MEGNGINKSDNFFLIAGPCVVESESLCMEVAETVSEICNELNIEYYFKASYRKANRSRLDSFTGIGDEKALKIIKSVGEQFSVKTLTDIHLPSEASIAASYTDVLQIPAFLCRQTELLEAAAKTNKIVNIKKGQFLSPEAMQYAVQKVSESGNNNIWVTERGTSFGYGDLVVDYRGIPTMQGYGTPVVMDVTHSLQQPNQSNGVTGGRPEMIATIAKAAIAAGADGIFIETHPNPPDAKSDGANMLPLSELKSLLETLVKIRQALV